MQIIYKKFRLIVFFIIPITIACNNKKENDFFSADTISKKNLIIDKIKLDTLNLDKIESSYLGFMRVINDSLYFIDNRFCWVYSFDTAGYFYSKYLGQGKGPKEIPTGYIDAYASLPDNGHMFFGSSWDCHVFNKKWERTKTYTINWNLKYSYKEILAMKHPDASLHGLYSLEWGKLRVKSFGNYVYLPIDSEHEHFFVDDERYFKEARILAKMNYKTGLIEKILGRRSPFYDGKFLGHFIYFSYDIDNDGNFYISYEPDSLIYKFDNNFKHLASFGYAGKNMNVNYTETKSIATLKKLYKKERKTLGYYKWIEYFDKDKLLFRSYAKGSHATTDGLQIYKENVLIADVDVPKNMSIEGYIEPYYYSNAIIDEINETIKVYRFKLKL